MSIEAMAAVMQARGISMGRKMVLLIMADHANKDGDAIWPSRARIAEIAGCTERHVKRVWRWAEAEGIIELCALERTERSTKVYKLNFNNLTRFQGNTVHPMGDFSSPRGGTNGRGTSCPPGGDTESPKPPFNHPCSDSSLRSESARDDDSKAPSPSLSGMIWRNGLDWLADQTGTPPDKLRSLIGKWRKEHGEEAVLSAFMQAQKNEVSEPVAWITGALKARDRPRLASGQEHIPIAY